MNLPNKLTMTRIIMIPMIIFFYLAEFIPQGYGKMVAFILFILASVTDWFDGSIARKRNIVTNFGKFADGIADKLLVMSVLLLFISDATLPSPWGVIVAFIIFFRDLIVQGIRSIASAAGNVIAADYVGKVKFFVSCFALPAGILVSMLAAFNVTGIAYDLFLITFYVLIGLTTILTVYSGVHYIVKYKKLINIKE